MSKRREDSRDRDLNTMNSEIKKERPPKKKHSKYSRQVTFVTAAFILLFFSLMWYTCDYAKNHQQELINNSYNSRQEILIAQNLRGKIYSADGQVLAETITDENGIEKRVYPFDNLFSHVVGYATNGKYGIEAQSNYYLINSNAKLADKVASEVSEQKYPGDSVYSTLNVAVQETAYQSLGIYKGAIIVTEPKTGKIIAMVSKPDFNPNEIDDIWNDLIQDKKSTVLLNRVTQGLYPPGSTFKIISALEYIKENPDTYNKYSYSCSGRFKNGEDIINCYHGTSHGQVDFKKSFAKSCNSSFANIGTSLDRNKYIQTLNTLLFNDDLPVSFAYNKSKVDLNENTAISDVMQISIGQGTTLITPLHLNMITSAIANKGILMKPYLVDRVENSNGDVIKQFSPGSYKRIIPEQDTVIMTELMESVVENGTATKLKGQTYTAAGKTGSAEYNSDKTDSHAWFTGFAPAEDPQVCVTIIIEGAGSGGDYAVPIAKRIFNTYFDN